MLQLEQGWSRGSQFPWRRSEVLREGRRAGEGSAGPFAALRPGCPQTPPPRGGPPWHASPLEGTRGTCRRPPGPNHCFPAFPRGPQPLIPLFHLITSGHRSLLRSSPQRLEQVAALFSRVRAAAPGRWPQMAQGLC